jgi:uncharacterized integral membrane protein
MSEHEAPEREQAPAPTQPTGSELGDGRSRDLSSRVREMRQPAMLVLALYAVLLIVLNTHSVSISFVFFTIHTALLVLIAVAGLLGFAGGYLVRRHKDAEKTGT